MQDRASAASLVTAGSVLLGTVLASTVLASTVLASTVLASTVLFAAGCASSPAADRTLRGRGPGHPRPARPAAARYLLTTVNPR
jgi:uncharacterized membrane protein YedE/YeeE